MNWFVTHLRDADPDVKYTETQRRCCEPGCSARFRVLYKGDEQRLSCGDHCDTGMLDPNRMYLEWT